MVSGARISTADPGPDGERPARPHAVRRLFAAYGLAKDQLCGHIKETKDGSKLPEFLRYLRPLHLATVRIVIVCDNCSPHLPTKRCRRVATWATTNSTETTCTPTGKSGSGDQWASQYAQSCLTVPGPDQRAGIPRLAPPQHQQQILSDA